MANSPVNRRECQGIGDTDRRPPRPISCLGRVIASSALPGVDLITAGEAFEDLILADLPRLPRPGEELRTARFLRTVGGGAVITAVAAARAGLRCHVISGLSESARRRLAREHVHATNLLRPQEPHAVSVALSTSAERTFVTFTGVNDRLEARLLRMILRGKARHVHFALSPVRCSRWPPILESLRQRGVTTSWDFGWNERLPRDREFLSLIASIDYLLMNEREATLYAGARRLTTAVAFWKRRARVAVVKLGSRGSRWIASGLDIQQPAPAVRVVDTTGAGDAFNGGFLAARLGGAKPDRALRAGNRMGALSTRAGGGIDGLPRRRERR